MVLAQTELRSLVEAMRPWIHVHSTCQQACRLLSRTQFTSMFQRDIRRSLFSRPCAGQNPPLGSFNKQETLHSHKASMPVPRSTLLLCVYSSMFWHSAWHGNGYEANRNQTPYLGPRNLVPVEQRPGRSVTTTEGESQMAHNR